MYYHPQFLNVNCNYYESTEGKNHVSFFMQLLCKQCFTLCYRNLSLSIKQEPPSPVMNRKYNRQESTSPRVTRRGTFVLSSNPLSGKHGSM